MEDNSLLNAGFDLSKAPRGPWNSLPKYNEFQKCAAKGLMLMNAMTAGISDAGSFFKPPVESAESKFTSSPGWWDLYLSGYYFYDAMDIDPWYGDLEHNWGISNALQANNLSDMVDSKGGKIMTRYVEHNIPNGEHSAYEQCYVMGGKQFTCTGATCILAINPEEGVLIALDRTSPVHRVKCHDNLIDPPVLAHTSDIMFALWKDCARARGTSIDNLHYFLSVCIDNDTALRIIREVAPSNLPFYPGVVFSTREVEGQALLGTPNGVAIGYLLSQHKAVLGLRYVDTVRVFKSESHDQLPCCMFHIAKVEDGTRRDVVEAQNRRASSGYGKE
ncbi:uncharacterized protein N0V89_005160 [Didymosphaeria variabile]|uniref:Uncharacterized protein n=1 Tax=Didymosphaeria variabile TaxID=1932322 RepID=A0A9W8XKJ6_9PLEO|nr:uncharacterized protein N0V89_005160 [Didymosphaeria variabile]KAJ4353431.1 hypothetical protein N0V89_005160 [Didymosphaeria variabile]